MEVKALIDNLTDSGCSSEGTRRAKALYEAGDMDGLVKHLRKYRCDLVEEMHDSQRKVDRMLNSGYEMPIMGLGTYSIDHDTCVNSVKVLLQNGGRLIDTAYMYGNEEAVGEGVRQAMEEYGIPREEIFVITKIYPSQFGDPEAAIDMALEKWRSCEVQDQISRL